MEEIKETKAAGTASERREVAKRGALSGGGGYLRIRKGELLCIQHEENEWLFGWSEEQQKRGWFPCLVLTKPSPPPEEEWEALQNRQKPSLDNQATSAAPSSLTATRRAPRPLPVRPSPPRVVVGWF